MSIAAHLKDVVAERRRTWSGGLLVLLFVFVALQTGGVAPPNASAAAPASDPDVGVRASVQDQVAAGYGHQCTIDAGDVRCWGLNLNGQLGYGHTSNIDDPAHAGVVDIGGTAIAVTAGAHHSCALRDDGRVLCWGRGDHGRLGYGNGTEDVGDDETPASMGFVQIGRRAIAVSAGYSHTCALLDNGKVRCWGNHQNGRLGNLVNEPIGDDEHPSSTPDVQAGDEVIDISAGDRITCAVLATGKVRCWGMSFFTMAFLTYCDTNPAVCDAGIGDDEHPSTEPTITIPQPDGEPDRAGGRRAVAVDAGDLHACALLDDGDVACWGYGRSGQLGYGERNGTVPPDQAAVIVELGGQRAIAVTAGHAYTCAAMANGESRCWGEASEHSEHLGNGATEDVLLPMSVPPVPTGGRAQAIVAGQYRTCALLVGGRSRCWGSGGSGISTLEARLHVVQLAAGRAHTCALSSDGRVRCWGANGSGQLGLNHTVRIGDDEMPASSPPVQLGGVAKAISAGADHTCAVMGNGDVRCWGNAGGGRLGYGNQYSIGDNEHPEAAGAVKLARRAVSVAAGGEHTCAVLDTGQVRCWGRGTEGQLGYGDTASFGHVPSWLPQSAGPVELAGRHRAKVVTTGAQHTCAVLSNGRAQCWGRGDDGRLGHRSESWIGDNETLLASDYIQLGSNREVVDIVAGDRHSCAILDNRTIRCFGLGADGRLGYGNVANIGDNEHPSTQDPVDVVRAAVSISAGGAHTCATLDDGSVRCWGKGAAGRLGYNSTANIGDNESPSARIPVQLPGGRAAAITAGGAHTCAVVLGGQVSCWGEGADGRLGYGATASIGDTEPPLLAGTVTLH